MLSTMFTRLFFSPSAPFSPLWGVRRGQNPNLPPSIPQRGKRGKSGGGQRGKRRQRVYSLFTFLTSTLPSLLRCTSINVPRIALFVKRMPSMEYISTCSACRSVVRRLMAVGVAVPPMPVGASGLVVIHSLSRQAPSSRLPIKSVCSPAGMVP